MCGTYVKCCQPGQLIKPLISRFILREGEGSGINHISMQHLCDWSQPFILQPPSTKKQAFIKAYISSFIAGFEWSRPSELVLSCTLWGQLCEDMMFGAVVSILWLKRKVERTMEVDQSRDIFELLIYHLETTFFANALSCEICS